MGGKAPLTRSFMYSENCQPASNRLTPPEARVLSLLFELTEGGSGKYVVEEDLLYAHIRKDEQSDLLTEAFDTLQEKDLLRSFALRIVTLVSEDQSTIVESAPIDDVRVVAFTPPGARIAHGLGSVQARS